MATVQKKGRVFFIFLFFISLGSFIFFPSNCVYAIGVSPATTVLEDVLVNTSQTRQIHVSRVAGEEIRSFTVTKKGGGVDLINFKSSKIVFEGDEMAKDFKFTVSADQVSPGFYTAELIFTPDNFAVRSSPTSTQAVVPTVTALVKITVTDRKIMRANAANSIIKIDRNDQTVFSTTVENKGNTVLSFDSVRVYIEDPKGESVGTITPHSLNPQERIFVSVPITFSNSFKNTSTAHFDLLKNGETVFSHGNASLIFTEAQAQPKKRNPVVLYQIAILGITALGIVAALLKYRKNK
jgi:hypothetical protein